MKRRLLLVVLVASVATVLAGCTPSVPFRFPTLYQGGGYGGMATEIDPATCPDVHSVASLDVTLNVEDPPSGELLGTAQGQVVVDFCRPVGDGTSYEVPGSMTLFCCSDEQGQPGDDQLSGPARVRRTGHRLTVDLDIEDGTGGYQDVTGSCQLGLEVYYGVPDPPPPANLSVSGTFDCQLGGPDGPPPPPAFRLTTSELPDAFGGHPPYRWRATGLPAGLRLRGASIVGRPRTPGEATIEVTVRDRAGWTRTVTLTLWTQNPDVFGATLPISTDPGRLWNGDENAVSDDGGVVAFSSAATGLTDPPGASNTWDVFVWDRTTNVMRRITDDRSPSYNYDVKLSGDGTTVMFGTYAPLTEDDTNGDLDLYLADVATGAFTLVSPDAGTYQGAVSFDGRTVAYVQHFADPAGATRSALVVWDRATGARTRVADGNGQMMCPELSDDGSRVAVVSSSSDLVPGDSNGHADVFVFDVPTGVVRRLDVGGSVDWCAGLSGDGTTVALTSYSTGFLPPGATDTNEGGDLFRADVDTGEIVRLTNGDAPTNSSPAVSRDGTIIAFDSDATDIARGERDLGSVPWGHDAFIWNGETGLVSRLTRSGNSYVGDLSGDGRTVSFYSSESDLAPGAEPVNSDWNYLYLWTRTS
jgi:Tol biopolymer transport system component